MILPAITFLPLLGAVVVLLLKAEERVVRAAALLFALATFLLSLVLPFGFVPGDGYQFTFGQDLEWLPFLGAKFSMAVDGISLYLVMLTTFITPIAILGAWNYIKDRQREFYIAMLIMETGMIGVFTSTDLFLFYVFFEAGLIPMYLIIGIWGGRERRYATFKFVLYTLAGSLLMFVAILYLYFQMEGAGLTPTFSIPTLTTRLTEGGPGGGPLLSATEQWWLFAAFALAFAIKVPVFPLHTWLPNAHVEAPTPGSVLLAAVLLKMGGYGFLRLAIPFFPDAAIAFAPLIIVLAIVSIIYGALRALAQDDMKKLIAYSSVSHLGFCMLGFFVFTVEGMTGGLYQMVNHGITSGALFLLAGIFYERRHTRLIHRYGGIASRVPVLTTIFVLITLGAIGLPLTNGFVGEFLVLVGSFKAHWVYGLLAGTGIILGAIYMLYLVLRVFFGPLEHKENESLPDASPREKLVLIPLVAMVFVMGIFPTFFTSAMEPDVRKILTKVNAEVEPAGPDRGSRMAVDPAPRPAGAAAAGAQLMQE
jgi:NADH-quinone oxidoreductase subunit M